MIYLDNAATTMVKPDCVIEAVTKAMWSMGNAGRGAHGATLFAAGTIFETRVKLAELFHAEGPANIAFTANSTEALNIAIKGTLQKGDHVVTTELEHNSVLRPLYEMEKQGVALTIVKSDKNGNVSYAQMEKAISDNTKAIICTGGSNLTGNRPDLKRVGQIAVNHDLLFIVDASQIAGAFPIDVQELGIDILCFTGHKSLFGPQGTGGIYVRDGVKVHPLKTGGSGIKTFSKTHPEQMPTALEAGTLNGHGIAGLSAAVDYINEVGMNVIREHEQKLMWRFYEGIKDVEGVSVYGDFTEKDRCPIVAFNIGNYDSSEVADVLMTDYEIACRAGGHCAPLMHMALGTQNQGAVRFSFSYHNTVEEVDRAIEAVKELANE